MSSIGPLAREAADLADLRVKFIEAATWHGDLDEAAALLAAHPELARADIHIAAILGDDDAVRAFIAKDARTVTAQSAPYGGDALNYLCLSKYLRHDASRSDAFVRSATALLDAGADPNTGFWTRGEMPERETALYGAAGVAFHAAMTCLLLERGADPIDEEVIYHSPEAANSEAMKLIVETGKLSAEQLSLMLIRKLDGYDFDGAKYLLARGANPNGDPKRGLFPLHHALARGNSIEMFGLLLDHGADAMLRKDGLTGVARAAREGRTDVLTVFERRGISVDLYGVDALIAACARDNTPAVRSVIARSAQLVNELLATGGTLLARFTSNGNTKGVQHLLELGVPPEAAFSEGDSYFTIPKGSLPIHVAAWRAHPAIVKLLIERGSPVDVPDADGRTPLALAVKACVDSYWTDRRSPESVRALLEAGASRHNVPYPSGYADVDELLK